MSGLGFAEKKFLRKTTIQHVRNGAVFIVESNNISYTKAGYIKFKDLWRQTITEDIATQFEMWKQSVLVSGIPN